MQEIYQTFTGLKRQVLQWASDRNLLKGATAKDQLHKLYQEVGELSDDICKDNDPRSEMGDVLVVALILCAQLGVTPEECLELAYNKIKDRRGVMRDGIFVKEEDL